MKYSIGLTITTFGLLCIAIQSFRIRKLEHPGDTRWYNAEVLVSVKRGDTNLNAKLNNIELGLREDGVLVFRTNVTAPIKEQ